MDPQVHKALYIGNVIKRLLVQVVVVGLALSLVSACSSGSSDYGTVSNDGSSVVVLTEDCKLILGAEDTAFPADFESLDVDAQYNEMQGYILLLYSIQPALQEPEAQKFVNDFLYSFETGEINGKTYSLENRLYRRFVIQFPRIVRDFYCQSL